MNYEAFIFIFLIAAILIYLALRLGLSIYVDYHNAAQVRGQLLQRLKLLQLQPLLRHYGLDNRELLHTSPLHEIERLIRRCENCDHKDSCARLVAGGNNDFEYCPLQQFLDNRSRDNNNN